MTITKFDKPTLRQIRTDLEKLLELFAESRGINIRVGNARFLDNTVDWKLHMSVIGDDGVVKTNESEALEKFYPQYVGKVVTLHSRKRTVSGTVIGFNSRAHTYPFLVKTENGKTYKVDEDRLK